MYNVEYVVGLNYGEEGIGEITAYVADKYNTDDTIVVLNDGGDNRHNEYTNIDCVKHMFHQLGTATLDGFSTYIGSKFLLNPITFKKEFEELTNLLGHKPDVVISENVALVLPCHIAMSCARYLYLHRDDSCIMTASQRGLYYARTLHSLYGIYCTLDKMRDVNTLKEYMRIMHQTYHNLMVADNDFSTRAVTEQYYNPYEPMFDDDMIEEVTECIKFIYDNCTVVNDRDELFNMGFKNFIVETGIGINMDSEFNHDDSNTVSYNLFPLTKYLFDIRCGKFTEDKPTVTYNYVSRWYNTRLGTEYFYYSDKYRGSTDIDEDMFGTKIEKFEFPPHYGAVYYAPICYDNIFKNIETMSKRKENNVNLFFAHMEEVTDRIPMLKAVDGYLHTQYKEEIYTLEGFIQKIKNEIKYTNIFLCYANGVVNVFDKKETDCNTVRIGYNNITLNGVDNSVYYVNARGGRRNNISIDIPVAVSVDLNSLPVVNTDIGYRIADAYNRAVNNVTATNNTNTFSYLINHNDYSRR